MTENPRFTEFLDHALALALYDDGDECVQAANDFIDAADNDNGWRGKLVEAWRDRWEPYQQERLEAAVWVVSAQLQKVLKE